MQIDEPGRSYQRFYLGVQRRKHHSFVEEAVARGGGRVLASTGGGRAPLLLGIETGQDERFAACIYAFMANHREIKNRPADEHRLQIRYGDVNDAAWRSEDHPVGFDPLGADVTLVVGTHIEADLIIGLDPLLYDPLPIGISIEFKDSEIQEAVTRGWHVWERDNLSGSRRTSPRAAIGVETIVAFSPERILDYLRFERDARALQLDPALRFKRAESIAQPDSPSGLHALEGAFSLSASEILDLIGERRRLGTAVRGGVAERHLEKILEKDPAVAKVEMGQADGPPDFILELTPGQKVTVECKNASPNKYADGAPKVETQKTRASKRDPKSRLYEPSQFDVVAACMYGPWERWEFRFKRSRDLIPDRNYSDRIAPMQRIDSSWSKTVAEAASAP